MEGKIQLPGLKVVGHIDLAQFKKCHKSGGKKNKKKFVPFTGGITIGEVLKLQRMRLV